MAFLIDIILLTLVWGIVLLFFEVIWRGVVASGLPPGSKVPPNVHVLIPALVFALPYTLWWNLAANLGRLSNELPALAATVAVVFSVLGKDGFGGRSPGKALFGLRVVDRMTLQPTSFGASLKRNLVLFLPLYIGHIVIALTLRRRGRFGEKWAGTMVVQDRYRNNLVFTGGHRPCRACGYDLTGNQSGRCPECGTDVQPHNSS